MAQEPQKLVVVGHGAAGLAAALAAAEQVRPPTMSRLVDDLEHLGLAERVAKPGDRRVYQVRVTDAGRSLLEEGRRKRLARLVEILGGATPSELRALESAAETIVRLTDSTISNTSAGKSSSSASYAPRSATRSRKGRN